MSSMYEYLMKRQEPEPSQLFLLRVWPEQEPHGKSGWTGKIQHVLSGEVQQFDDLASLQEYLQSMLTAEDKSR